MRQADITFVAWNAAATAAARQTTGRNEADFTQLHAYALVRRDVDQQRRFPSAEVLARRHSELAGRPFGHVSLEAAPRAERIFWTLFRAVIEALEPFRDAAAEPLFPPITDDEFSALDDREEEAALAAIETPDAGRIAAAAHDGPPAPPSPPPGPESPQQEATSGEAERGTQQEPASSEPRSTSRKRSRPQENTAE